MLQSIRTMPSSCSQRITEINQTIQMQLDDNKLLYVTPRPYSLTILCSGQKPSGIEIVGICKLILHSTCKAYGARVLIQAQTVLATNSTNKDIIPPLSLEYDCCGLDLDIKSNKLSEIHLDLSTKNIVNHLENLRLAIHVVEEVGSSLLSRSGRSNSRNLTITCPFYLT
jgi:hypothetical protein